MDKIFAVAMVFRRYDGHKAEDHLMLHIVRDCASKGDAFLKAFEKEKSTLFKDGGCTMKVVLEIDLQKKEGEV